MRWARSLRAAKPDIMVVIGDDQHEWFTEELQPTFGVFCGGEVTNFAPTAEEMALHTREGRGAAVAGYHPPADQPYPIAKSLAEHMIAPVDAGRLRCRGDHGAAQTRP